MAERIYEIYIDYIKNLNLLSKLDMVLITESGFVASSEFHKKLPAQIYPAAPQLLPPAIYRLSSMSG